MFIKLAWFLYAYYAFLALWSVMALVAVYHMLKFGFKGLVTFLSTFVFVLIAISILSVSFYSIIQVDWNIEIPLFNGLSTGYGSDLRL